MKKKIPLDLLKALEPAIQKSLDIVNVAAIDNTYYALTDKDYFSGFYFNVYIDGSKVLGNYTVSKYTIKRLPYSENYLVSGHAQCTVPEVVQYYNEWITFIRTYNDTKSVHDDNFFKKYFSYFSEAFRIVDADAEVDPFSPSEQSRVEELLLEIGHTIEEDPSLSSSDLGHELRVEINATVASLSTSTKNEVMRSLSRFCAKLYHRAKPTALVVIKKILDKLLEAGINLLPEMVKKLI